MKNKKGQALIEFVLILPVLIIIIFSIIDFGRIIITKNELENRINDVVYLLDKDTELSDVEDLVNEGSNTPVRISLTYDNEKYLTIKVESDVTVITPGLNLILGSPYKAKGERVIVYEKQ